MYRCKNYIPTKKKDGEWFSNRAIVIFALINMYTKGHDGLFYYNITTDCIGMELYGDINMTARQRQNVKDGFVDLMEHFSDAIEPVDKKETIWKVDVERFVNIDNNYQYAYCYNDDFMSVLHAKNSRTYNLAGFYMKFLSTFDFRYGLSKISMKYMAKIMDISVTTIQKNIEKLKNIGVIKSYEVPATKNKDGEYVRYPNIYYRSGEWDLVSKYIENGMQGLHGIRNSQPSSG